MVFLGLRMSTNVLAVILATGVIIICLAITYIFQKKYFSRYRRKVPNAVGGSVGNQSNKKSSPDDDD